MMISNAGAMQALDTVFDQPSVEREAWARSRYADDQELLTRVLRLLVCRQRERRQSSARVGRNKSWKMSSIRNAPEPTK